MKRNRGGYKNPPVVSFLKKAQKIKDHVTAQSDANYLGQW